MKVADPQLLLARKAGLGNLAFQHGQDLAVRNVAHLVVLLHNFAVLVANTSVAGLHQGVASLVFGTDIAVDAGPSLVAFARIALSHRPFLAAGQRATSYSIVSQAGQR